MESQHEEKQTLSSHKMTENETFEQNGYLFVPGMVVDPEFIRCPVPDERGQFIYTRKDKVEYVPEEIQVKGSVSRYNLPYYKELHYLVKKEVEKILSVDLHPTYYFDRFYFTGQQLERHTDRPSCEISVTMQISSNGKEPWPIWFERPDGTESFVNMKDGDAVIYKGCEREHWRDPLKSRYNRFQRMFRKDDTYHHQIFFHYVNANGPYVNFAFDRGV
jgi:hypothetical protein